MAVEYCLSIVNIIYIIYLSNTRWPLIMEKYLKIAGKLNLTKIVQCNHNIIQVLIPRSAVPSIISARGEE
jgi:hypothetical protein